MPEMRQKLIRDIDVLVITMTLSGFSSERDIKKASRLRKELQHKIMTPHSTQAARAIIIAMKNKYLHLE